MSRPPSRLSVSSANSRTRLAKSSPTATMYSTITAAAGGNTRRCGAFARSGSAAVSNFRGGPHGAAEELAEPQLQHEQRPEVRRAIDAAGKVIVNQRLDGLAAEVPPVQGDGRQHRVLEQRPELAPQPLADRNTETHFGPRQNLRGQAIAHELPEKP